MHVEDIRSGKRRGFERPRNPVPEGSHDRAGPASGLDDIESTGDAMGDRGLPVGSGNRDDIHSRGGRTVEAVGSPADDTRQIVGLDELRARARNGPGGRHYCDRPRLERGADVPRSVGSQTRAGEEHEARFHPAAIRGEASYRCVARQTGVQVERVREKRADVHRGHDYPRESRTSA